jgi:hypothetical protein
MNNKDITNTQTEANIKQSIGDYDFKSLANQYASTPMTRDIRKDVPSTPPTERQTLMGVRDKTPENHMKAYITPEEGELLKRAGGSGVMTSEGIPMYENDLTADEMEDELKESENNYKSIMDRVYKEAEERLSPETRDRLLQEAMEQNRKLEANEDFAGSMSNEAASDRVNLMYDVLLEDELAKYDTPAFILEARDKLKRVPAKLKSLMGKFVDDPKPSKTGDVLFDRYRDSYSEADELGYPSYVLRDESAFEKKLLNDPDNLSMNEIKAQMSSEDAPIAKYLKRLPEEDRKKALYILRNKYANAYERNAPEAEKYIQKRY